jgi:hypothetical protein
MRILAVVQNNAVSFTEFVANTPSKDCCVVFLKQVGQDLYDRFFNEGLIEVTRGDGFRFKPHSIMALWQCDSWSVLVDLWKMHGTLLGRNEMVINNVTYVVWGPGNNVTGITDFPSHIASVTQAIHTAWEIPWLAEPQPRIPIARRPDYQSLSTKPNRAVIQYSSGLFATGLKPKSVQPHNPWRESNKRTDSHSAQWSL